MKKIVLLPLLLFVLTACNSGSSNCTCIGGSSEPKETVSLTKENFSKYVGTYSSSSVYDAVHSVTYYTHFVGASDCKFIDCSVTYNYTFSTGVTAINDTTVQLTLSGDGETVPFAVQPGSNNGVLTFKLISVNGTIEVYK